MLGLIVAFVALLGLTAAFVIRPLLAGDAAEGSVKNPAREELSSEERAAVQREIRWRLDHDRASGRLNEEEYRQAVAALEASATAGAAGGE